MRTEMDRSSGELPMIALAIPGAQTGRLISALGSVVRRGHPLYCLDGGNVFNPLRLAAMMRRRGFDPAPLLERIFVSRAYTCHQLAGAVETLLAPLAESPERPLAVLLGIDRLFVDEDIPMYERRHLFERILERAGRLHRRGLPILITFGAEEAKPWAGCVRRAARVLPDVRGALAFLEERSC